MSTQLAASRPFAREERREDPLDREHAGRDVGDRDAEPEGRPVGRAGDAHQARPRPASSRRTRPPRAAGPVCPNPEMEAVDDPRMARVHLARSRAPAAPSSPAGSSRRATSARASSASRIGRARGCLRSSARLSLFRLTLRKYALSRADKRRSPRARVVAAPRLLDLDHARAEIRELHRAVRPREHAREVEHDQAVERTT